jgi:putative oxidoreductase
MPRPAGSFFKKQEQIMSNSTVAPPTFTLFNSASILPFVGRMLIAAIFILSGLSKAADPAGTIGYISSTGLPLPQVGFAVALVVEILGGILLVVGFRTRLVATVLAIFTLATAFAFHFQLADQNQFIHFFKNLAMVGGLVQVISFGPGGIGVDARS